MIKKFFASFCVMALFAFVFTSNLSTCFADDDDCIATFVSPTEENAIDVGSVTSNDIAIYETPTRQGGFEVRYDTSENVGLANDDDSATSEEIELISDDENNEFVVEDSTEEVSVDTPIEFKPNLAKFIVRFNIYLLLILSSVCAITVFIVFCKRFATKVLMYWEDYNRSKAIAYGIVLFLVILAITNVFIYLAYLVTF